MRPYFHRQDLFFCTNKLVLFLHELSLLYEQASMLFDLVNLVDGVLLVRACFSVEIFSTSVASVGNIRSYTADP